jgi:lysophospholipase-3
LTALVERAYAAAENTKVTIISHSMGGLQTKYFLEKVSQEWKDKFIRRWIPISAPLIGAGKEFRLFSTGDSEGIPGVSAGTIRGEQRSYESNHWLLPTQQGWNDTIFVETDSKNYTTSDYDQFFKDIGYPVGNLVRPRVQSLINPYSAPNVEVDCFYSHGVDTPNSFKFKGSPTDWTKPVTVNVDGDGTVPEASLEVCRSWTGK